MNGKNEVKHMKVILLTVLLYVILLHIHNYITCVPLALHLLVCMSPLFCNFNINLLYIITIMKY